MNKRKGFTLIELMVAIIIFSFMIMSMTAMYITAEKHMFQNLRYDKLRTSLTTAVKFIKLTSSQGTRIDSPSVGGSSGSLAFASNVDSRTGCYPINPSVQARWHYICAVACPASLGYQPGAQCLYYHTQPISGGGGCPYGAAWNAAGSYPIRCGVQTRGASEQVTLLMPYVAIPSSAPNIFSRAGLELNVVRAAIRVRWIPPASLSSVSRPVDTTLETYLSFNIAAQ